MTQAADFSVLTSRFAVGLADPERVIVSVRAVDLTRHEAMDHLLKAYAPLMKATMPAAAATYFCGWLRNAAFALQFSLSLWNKAIDLSLDNVYIQLVDHGSYYGFAFRLNAWNEQDGPLDGEERQEWLRRVLSQFYGETLRPIMEAASAAGSIHVAQLWGQLPTGLPYFEEGALAATTDLELQDRIREDVVFVRMGLDGEVFGRKRNPFNVRYQMVASAKDPDKQVPLKTACCLYYCTENGSYCYTCPKLSEAQRSELFAKLQDTVKV